MYFEDIDLLPRVFFVMHFIEFGAPNGTKCSEGDRTLSFEMSGSRRDVRFTSFPVIVAVSSTVHNAQGSTFNGVIIRKICIYGSQ